MSQLLNEKSLEPKPYEFGDEIVFTINERIANSHRHGVPRPLVVLLQRARTKWHWYGCCGKMVLALYNPGVCDECFNANQKTA